MEEPMKLKDDIDLINVFSSDFYNKTNLITNKISETIQKTERVIQDEKQNNVYLSNLEKKVTDIELNLVKETLQTYQKTLEDKQIECNTLLEDNSKKISQVSNIIRNNKNLIDDIYSLMNNLDAKVSNLNKYA
jgi:hypothetical protein